MIGVNTCGGCPGKKVVARAAEMVERGFNGLLAISGLVSLIPWKNNSI